MKPLYILLCWLPAALTLIGCVSGLAGLAPPGHRRLSLLGWAGGGVGGTPQEAERTRSGDTERPCCTEAHGKKRSASSSQQAAPARQTGAAAMNNLPQGRDMLCSGPKY